ncbi:3-oxoacyl-[acyl-carrier-protein] synthase III C-terminal domain-containing protein [Aeromonas popoffii]|uniref:3-oxoacyl-[acyl-carrier-protein] synthase III C-terminal domain-containing protein n=1 Tax=Aeromonas popoffii TaxID=70856 RepID=UPI0005A9FC49|nr:3-oxoacyl-[acyl-carrier-protein] synthase III C-terminal domain-containing protein [Aeromonas popoffii]
MKIIGIGQAQPSIHSLKDVQHPKPLQLEAIRLAGFVQYGVSTVSARKMASQAVQAALIDAGCRAEQIDFIVAGQSGIADYPSIDLACQVGAELGGLVCRTVNLLEGCGSAISAFMQAALLAPTLSAGQIGVIVLAQRMSEPHQDRFGLMNAILSDGAAALVVCAEDGRYPAKLVYRGAKDISDTRYVDMMRTERGGSLHPWLPEDRDSRMDPLGRELIMQTYQFGPGDLLAFLALRMDRSVEIIQACLQQVGWTLDPDMVLLHTLEGHQSMDGLLNKLGLFRSNRGLVADWGHVGCADQLISLNVLYKEGKIQQRDKILLSAISTGMKWGCAALECVANYDDLKI